MQSGYVTLDVQTRDGAVFRRGTAELEVVLASDEPVVTLQVEANDGADEAWSGRFRVPASALDGSRATLALAPETARATLARTRGETTVAESGRVELVLEREAQSGRRAVLKATLTSDSSALSGELRAELDVTCLVRPEALGQDANGVIDSEFKTAVSLVVDEDLSSPGCRKFANWL